MKCEKCGSEIPEVSRFCPNCGEKVSVEDVSLSEPNIPNKRFPKWIIGVGVGVIALVLIGIILFRPKTKELVLADYINVKFAEDSINGYGYLEIINEDANLYDEDHQYLDIDRIRSDYPNDEPGYEDFLLDLQIRTEVPEDYLLEENYKNGDTAEVHFYIDESIEDLAKTYGLKLNSDKAILEAKGFKEPQNIDPFDYLKVVQYMTKDGEVYVRLDVKENDWFTEDEFTILSQLQTFKVGAAIQVEFNLGEDLDNPAIKVSNFKKEYNIDCKDHALGTEEEDFKKESIEKIIQYSEEKLKESLAEEITDIEVNNLKFEKSHIFYQKDPDDYYGELNVLYLTFSADISSKSYVFGPEKRYYSVGYGDLFNGEDGLYAGLDNSTDWNFKYHISYTDKENIEDDEDNFQIFRSEYAINMSSYAADFPAEGFSTEEDTFKETSDNDSFIELKKPLSSNGSNKNTSANQSTSSENSDAMNNAQTYGTGREEGTEIGEFDGHAYAIFNFIEDLDIDNYEDCEYYCEDMGGHLAIINSPEENQFLFDYLKENGKSTAFFGYSNESGEWEWVEDQGSKYKNWDPTPGDNGKSQPNNATGNEHYAQFSKTGDGTWNDTEFGKGSYRMICEWE